MRLIDADALMEEMEEALASGDSCIKTEEEEYLWLLAMQRVRQAPTVERPRGEWISVEDRLPNPFETVLVHMPLEKPLPTVHAGYISKDGEWVGGLFNRDKDEVTHWMPLPEAPDMRGEGE